MMTTVSFYTITAYTPTFGRLLHLPAGESLAVTAGVGLSNLAWLPLMGTLSDRVGRRPILLACTGLAILTAYPAMAWLAAAPSAPRLLAVELWLSALYGGYNAAMVVFLTEIVPAEFGRLASAWPTAWPPLSAVSHLHRHLVDRSDGRRPMPGAWLTLAAAVALAVILLSPPPRAEAGQA